MNYIVLFVCSVILTTSVISVHLDRRTKEKEKIGDITKCFLMPTLYFTLFTAHLAFNRNINNPMMMVFIALFYCLGDIFLLSHEKLPFICGAASFMVGHILYIIYFAQFGINIYSLIFGMILFGVLFIFLLYKVIKKKPNHLVPYLIYGLTLYIFGVGVSSSFTLSHPKTGILAIIGALLYCFSDASIAFNNIFPERKKTSQFLIMLTYVLANISLVLSVWCINAPI